VGFWKALLGFSWTARICFGLSLLLGLILLGLGFWGELSQPNPPSWWPQGQWKKLGYGLNILASLTGFLIGLPIALVFLETIKSNALEKKEIESVTRISKAAWTDFSVAINDLCTDKRIDAVKSTDDDSSPAAQVNTEHDVIMEKLEACRAEICRDRSKASAQIASLKTFLAAHATTFEEKRKVVDSEFGNDFTLRRKWNYILSLWQVLDTHVRLRRIELELEPMEKDTYTRLLDDLTSDENPVFVFLNLHDGVSSKEDGLTSMLSLQSLMDTLISLPDSQLEIILIQHYAEYIGIGVKSYDIKAWSASMFLSMLKLTVNHVTKSGWPG
jgi:hypothetical protein